MPKSRARTGLPQTSKSVPVSASVSREPRTEVRDKKTACTLHLQLEAKEGFIEELWRRVQEVEQQNAVSATQCASALQAASEAEAELRAAQEAAHTQARASEELRCELAQEQSLYQAERQRCDDLAASLAQFTNQDAPALHSQVSMLQSRIQTLESELEQARGRSREMQEETRRARGDARWHVDTHTQLLQKLHQDLNQANLMRDAAEVRARGVETRSASLTEQVAQLRHLVDSQGQPALREELAAARAAHRELQESRASEADRAQQAQNQLLAATNQITVLTSQQEALRRELGRSEQELKCAQEEANSLRGKVHALSVDLQEMHIRMTQLGRAGASDRLSLSHPSQEEQGGWLSQMQRIHRDKETLHQMLIGPGGQLEDGGVDEQLELRRSHQREMASLKALLANERVQARQMAQQMQAELEQRDDRISELLRRYETQRATSQRELESLSEAVARAESELAATRHVSARLVQLEHDLAAANRRTEEAQTELRRCRHEAQAAAYENDARLWDRTAPNSDLLESLGIQKKALEVQMEAAEERVRLAKADARELRGVVSDLQQQLGERTQALDEAAAAMREADEEVRWHVERAEQTQLEHERDMSRLELEKGETTQALTALQAEMDARVHAEARRIGSNNELAGEVARLKEQVVSQESLLAAKQAELEGSKAELVGAAQFAQQASHMASLMESKLELLHVQRAAHNHMRSPPEHESKH